MSNFTYTWQDGTVTSIPLSSQTGWSCDRTSPDTNMHNAPNQIVLHSSDGINPQNPNDSAILNDQENYCIAGLSALQGMYDSAVQIYNKWDIMEIECANWNNWFRHCNDKGIYCYMSENELENSYYQWQPIVTSIAQNMVSLTQIWQNASAQIELNGDQATDQALLDQLISETNNIISITAFNNESRELKVASKKTSQIFMPIIIGLILLGIGFYLYKK